MIMATLATEYEICLVSVFALLKFDLHEDKLELAYLISNLTTKRDLRFDFKDDFRSLERFQVG